MPDTPKLRRAALSAVGVIVVILLLLWLTGTIGPIYRWVVRYFQPEVWSALAAWVAVGVGIVTVLVAGRYAKRQVEEARRQVSEAQSARLAQERQAQEALETQIRLANEAVIAQAKLNQQTLEHDAAQAQKIRREQAQPNVVLYTEPNPYVPQIIEIVMKNFGATPAYHIKVDVTPPIKAIPGEKLVDVAIPDFPILVPGQEWRTVWDSPLRRKDHSRSLQQLMEFPEFGQADLQERTPASRHNATVTYVDSEGESHRTASVLDFDQREGTTWVDIKTIHDLTKLLDTQLKEQIKRTRRDSSTAQPNSALSTRTCIYGSGVCRRANEDEREPHTTS